MIGLLQWVKGRISNYTSYALSYLVLVCVALLIVGVMVYGTFGSAMEREIDAAALSMLKQVRDATDARMMDMNRIAQQIAANPDLISDVPASEGYRMGEMVRSLAGYKAANGFAGEIAVYYRIKSDDKVYAASGMYSIESFFDHAYRYRDWGSESFLREVGELRRPLFRPLEPVVLNGVETRNVATYLYPLPLNANRPYGVILFQIDERELGGMIRNVLKDEAGYAFIADERGAAIAYAAESGKEHEAATLLGRLPDFGFFEGARTLKLDGEKMFAARIVSAYNGWTYLSLVPANRALLPVHRSRTVFTWSVLGILLLGTVLSFVFAARNYRKEQRLQTVIKSQERIVKEKELLDLIRGRAKPPDQRGLSFPYGQFAVVQFLIDDYRRIAGANSKSGMHIIKLSLTNVLEELSGDLGQGYVLEWVEPGGVVLVLNLKDEKGTAHMRALAEEANRFFERYFRFTLTAGIGGVYRETGLLYKSFLEANYAARYRYLQGGGKTFVHDDIHRQETGDIRYPYDAYPLLAAAIRKGDKTEARQRIADITERLAMERSLTVEMAEHLSFDIVHTVMKTLTEAGIELKDDAAGSMAELFAGQFETLTELEEAVVRFCDEVCDDIAMRKESKNVGLLADALAFVHERYADGTLSLDMLADNLGVSRSYLSRYFKDQTGTPLMQYVDSLRMAKAKELLRDTDLNIKTIVGQVGLVDPNNFFRKFKKSEGITPAEYRSMCGPRFADVQAEGGE